jgi:hypothetical protein
MPEDIKEQLLTRIKSSPKLALQINESTDIAGLPQLLVFVRYCFEENIMKISCSVDRSQTGLQK